MLRTLFYLRLFLIELSCLFFLTGIMYAAGEQDLIIKKRELGKVGGRIQLLQEAVSEDQSKQADLQQQLETDEVKMGHINQQMHRLNLQLSHVQGGLQKIKAAQLISLNQLKQQQYILGQQMKMIYQLGHTTTLKNLLNPQDINTTNRHMVYYHYLNQAHLTMMANVKQSVEILTKNMLAISEKEANLNNLLIQKKQQQLQLENTRTSRSFVIEALNKHTHTKQQELTTLSTNQKNLQTMLSSLQNESTNSSSEISFRNLKRKLAWPLKGNFETLFGGRQKSPGVVINAPEGTTVHAIYGGKVIFANWLRGFGLLVIINHGDGFMSLYGRNQALFASVGDTVQPDEAIASIGNTGGYSKTSLYFEIRHNGIPVNPKIWCI